MHTLLKIITIWLTVNAVSPKEPDTTALVAISESSASFNGDLLKVLVANDGLSKNLIFSALSVSTVLSMTSCGAKENTLKEMKTSLHLPDNDKTFKLGFKNLIECLKSTENVTLNIANKIFVRHDLELKPAFKAATLDHFHSSIQPVDFARTNEAVDLVNNWAAQQTNNKIKEILKNGDVDKDTGLILCNAIYFKGEWNLKFNPKDTKNLPFHVDNKTVKQVPTMFKKGKFYCGKLPKLKAQFIELHYKNKHISMLIFVPDATDGLSFLIEELSKVKTIDEVVRKGYKQEALLHLPKFKIESELNLNEPLKKLGMVQMFDDNEADFSGITDVKKLKISKVVQKAYIEVTEEGTEAAAVTAAIQPMCVPPPPLNINANKPFLYLIVRKSSVEPAKRTNKKSAVKVARLPLFTGFVVDPSLK